MGERESYLSVSITLPSLSYDHFNLGCLQALVISMMTMFPLFLRCIKLYTKADKKCKDGCSMNSVTDMNGKERCLKFVSKQNMKKKNYEIMYRLINIPKLRVSFNFRSEVTSILNWSEVTSILN